MIDYDALMSRKFPDVEHSYTEKDCILYALGLGLGSDPLSVNGGAILGHGSDGIVLSRAA
jgi:hypothetical protein